jgi:DNA polymerase-4
MLAEVAEELVRWVLEKYRAERTITLLAIAVSHLEPQSVIQLALPYGLAGDERNPGSRRGAARWTADRAVDAIRDRFGRESVGYATVVLNGPRSVPDAFRELAERKL